ncbi:MAG: AMP-binding protein, partial [Firmicutes bacterium]|nr:AMP-binding protein [Bacillota bacterium]
FLVDKDNKITFKEAYDIVKTRAMRYDFKHQPVIVKVDRSANTVLEFLSVIYSDNFYVPVDGETTEQKLELIRSQLELIDKTQDILYVIFTSGSTGTPKGVIKSPRSMIAFVRNFAETFNIDENEVIANQSPFMFDASAKDVYLSLYLGCTLHVLHKELFSFPGELIKYLNSNKITFASWVPSAFIIWARLKVLKQIKPETLRRVFFVGEVFPTKYINYFLENLPDVRYANLYGSTETAGVVLYYAIPDGNLLDENKPLPLGKPLKNNDVYLSGDGEILVESEQIALGYVNDVERNAQTFVNGVLHTGDYAKYDEEGNIVFVTRKDFQIKHMGYRIELQEIEHYANSLPYVDMSVCIYDNDAKKIVLSIVPSKEHPQNIVAQTILDLKTKLPFYMVPGKVVPLKEIDLNRNGKIDREKTKEKIYGKNY